MKLEIRFFEINSFASTIYLVYTGQHCVNSDMLQ